MNGLVMAAPVLLWLLSMFYCGFLFLFRSIYKARPSNKTVFLMGSITAGLFYDAFVLALGSFVPGGNFLKAISLPRYILHGALIPLLLPLCGMALGAKNKTMAAIWAATGLLSAGGFAAGCQTLLTSETFAGITRYIPGADSPTWANRLLAGLSIGPILILIGSGIAVWVKQKNPHLFFAGFFMFVFAGVAPKVKPKGLHFLVSMFGECFMLLFFWLFLKKQNTADA